MIRARRVIAAEITFIRAEDGGRQTLPRLEGADHYRPHLVVTGSGSDSSAVDDANVADADYLGVELLSTSEEFIPGEIANVEFQLLSSPAVNYARLQPGTQFTIREGSRIVGFGRVTGRRDGAS